MKQNNKIEREFSAIIVASHDGAATPCGICRQALNEFNPDRLVIMVNDQGEVKNKLGKIFAALREEVDELIELADKKPGLSEPERRIKEKLRESLDISEEFISKEVDDVEKEIKMKKKEEK